MCGIFRHIPGIFQPISHTRYMSRICLIYSFLVISSLCLEYSRHIPRIFFPSHLVICLDYTWIIPLLAAAMPWCDWDATAVTVHVIWCQGCLIFSAKRGGHACQRQSVSRCSPIIDCGVAAAANPQKISWSRWCTHETCAMHRQEGK